MAFAVLVDNLFPYAVYQDATVDPELLIIIPYLESNLQRWPTHSNMFLSSDYLTAILRIDENAMQLWRVTPRAYEQYLL